VVADSTVLESEVNRQVTAKKNTKMLKFMIVFSSGRYFFSKQKASEKCEKVIL